MGLVHAMRCPTPPYSYACTHEAHWCRALGITFHPPEWLKQGLV